eukprot:5758296-Pyramimonas_sp.AAC.1
MASASWGVAARIPQATGSLVSVSSSTARRKIAGAPPLSFQISSPPSCQTPGRGPRASWNRMRPPGPPASAALLMLGDGPSDEYTSSLAPPPLGCQWPQGRAPSGPPLWGCAGPGPARRPRC